MRVLKYAAVSLFAACWPLVTQAENAAAAPESFTLENGMEIVVVPDHRAPVVTHIVWYKVGAVDEAPGKSGMAHLFEHVMSHATDDLKHREIDTIVKRNGGYKNAFTSWDYTGYIEQVSKDKLGKMMELEAERMTDLIIDEAADKGFLAERDVVREERRQNYENRPERLLQEKVFAEFWKGHPYEIMTIGRMDEVAALRPEDGRLFYDTYYTPRNAIAVIVGDVTAADVRPLAEMHYGPIANKTDTVPDRKWRPVPDLAETLTVTHADPKVRQPVISRYYKGTSMVRDKEDAMALSVALGVLGSGPTSKLYQALVEDRKLAISVGSYAWTGLHDEGPAVLYASPADGVTLDELDAAVMEAARAVMAEGLSEADVTRVRNSLAAEAIYDRDNQRNTANAFGRALTIGMTIDDLLTYPDDIRKVTAEEATAALRKVFAEDKHYIEARLLPVEGDL